MTLSTYAATLCAFSKAGSISASVAPSSPGVCSRSLARVTPNTMLPAPMIAILATLASLRWMRRSLRRDLDQPSLGNHRVRAAHSLDEALETARFGQLRRD